MISDNDVSYVYPMPENYYRERLKEAAGLTDEQLEERHSTPDEIANGMTECCLVIHKEGFSLSPQDIADLFD